MAATKKKAVRKAKKGERIRQVAAIPFRLTADGDIEVMLVTSRTTKRFIVPKGWPMKGKSGRKAAAIEAQEEAGVLGKALSEPAGTYSYWKRLTNRFVRVDVIVYLLEVTEELANWQEAKRRQRAWLAPADAAMLIDEPDLSTLVKTLKLPGPAAVDQARNNSGKV
ncbi:NUDIX hydrolase [Mesorhizobium sp. dw_380]|uniref:NUDIX hydrolase n=1 Tax=Mesorhizobium sp. dw_380 TaxID=2812001 RepID=UPI001BDE20B4|nr:NUDIX hydrolase [Mesorhizobium sp. dw_380]